MHSRRRGQRSVHLVLTTASWSIIWVKHFPPSYCFCFALGFFCFCFSPALAPTAKGKGIKNKVPLTPVGLSAKTWYRRLSYNRRVSFPAPACSRGRKRHCTVPRRLFLQKPRSVTTTPAFAPITHEVMPSVTIPAHGGDAHTRRLRRGCLAPRHLKQGLPSPTPRSSPPGERNLEQRAGRTDITS